MSKPDFLSWGDRETFTDLLAAALNGSRKPDGAALGRAAAALGEPEHEALRAKVAAEGLRQLIWAELKRISKRESLISVGYNGSVVRKPSRIGVVETTHDGGRSHQQELFTDCTWDQLEEYRKLELAASDARAINAQIAERLLALHDRFPDTDTVGAALDLLGMTLDEFLGETA